MNLRLKKLIKILTYNENFLFRNLILTNFITLVSDYILKQLTNLNFILVSRRLFILK